MQPKPTIPPEKPEERRKSILVSPPAKAANVGKVSTPEDFGGGKETEIAAHISVPRDGGWGWVVLFCSFCSIFCLDGIAYTFGALLPDIAREFNVSHSLVALINSLAFALYFMLSPISSALINRYGFRATIMTGSVISSVALFSSYFSTRIAYLFVFYGFFNGFGCSLIQMSAGLIVGFYFEKLRAIALAIVTCGTSLGVVVMSPVNTHLVRLCGWRPTVLLQSGMIGMIFFFGMTFKPLLSLTVTKFEDTIENPTRTVTFLPNLAAANTSTKSEALAPSGTERFFKAVSNYSFPTAASVVDENTVREDTRGQAGPSTAAVQKITLTPYVPPSGISQHHLKQAESLRSRSNFKDKSKLEISLPEMEPKKVGCCGQCCKWEAHVPHARPMYRDDAFYQGRLENLPIYQKSTVSIPEQARTGLEYQLAVTRAGTVNDLQDRRGICTIACRRVLVTMIDPSLLKDMRFLMLCCSGFLTFAGLLVPFVFLKDKNEKAGVDPEHCVYFVSTIAIANTFGKCIFGLLSSRVNPVLIYGTGCILAGLSTILSSLSYTVMYQYGYCICFGFFLAAVSSVRSIMIVSLFGLEKLTNCTGMMLMFVGLGMLLSTPLGGYLKEKYGSNVAFYVAGTFMLLSGLVVLLITTVKSKEKNIGTVPVVVKGQRKSVSINLSKMDDASKEAKTIKYPKVVLDEKEEYVKI